MRRALLIGSALVVVLAALVFAKLRDSGDLNTLTPLGVEACRNLSPPPNVHGHGLEDLVRTRSGAILSGADLRSYLLRGGYNVSRALHKHGAVFSYHPSDGTLRHVAVSGYDHEHFHPHGLGLLYGKDKLQDTLFMVNHRLDPAYSVPTTLEAVELFKVHENSVTNFKLTHIETVVHPLFRALNDVVPIDADTFYFTNWFHYRGDSNPLMKWVELLTAQPWSNIGLCSRSKQGGQDREWQCKLVVEGLGMANGMDLSLDGKYLFVVADYTKNLLVYERHPDHSLQLVEDIPLGYLCDNVVTAASGELHVACHAKAFSFLFLHLSNPSKYPSPSVVLRIEFDKPGNYRMEEVLVSVGKPINAASAATVTAGQIVLGSVTQEGLTVCDGF